MKDICIVGFGLAGMSIAKHAQDFGFSFDIYSDTSQKSSRVAGGILNPVSVKRMKPVWKVEEFLNYAKNYYSHFSNIFDINFCRDIAMKVVIHNTEQENNWFEAYDKPRLKPFLQQKLIDNDNPFIKANKLGIIQATLVDLPLLFKTLQDYYSSKYCWFNESFDYNELTFSDDSIMYYGKRYQHIIFCEGFGVTNNPYFNELGIYGNKGDYLIFKSKSLQLESMLKAKYFLIPLGHDIYKFGATYQREPLDHLPSKEAKNQMQEALDKILQTPYSIIDQVCGIRPTTKDRKPILGTHKTINNMHVLNGFGSRGVMTSPKLGLDLLEFIFKGKPLEKEVSIERIYAQI